jgi:hypothetical protein
MELTTYCSPQAMYAAQSKVRVWLYTWGFTVRWSYSRQAIEDDRNHLRADLWEGDWARVGQIQETHLAAVVAMRDSQDHKVIVTRV